MRVKRMTSGNSRAHQPRQLHRVTLLQDERTATHRCVGGRAVVQVFALPDRLGEGGLTRDEDADEERGSRHARSHGRIRGYTDQAVRARRTTQGVVCGRPCAPSSGAPRPDRGVRFREVLAGREQAELSVAAVTSLIITPRSDSARWWHFRRLRTFANIAARSCGASNLGHGPQGGRRVGRDVNRGHAVFPARPSVARPAGAGALGLTASAVAAHGSSSRPTGAIGHEWFAVHDRRDAARSSRHAALSRRLQDS